jgi:hypothetical protein
MNEETTRISEEREGKTPWKKWGPYLSERSWSTVREDYSPDGAAWEYFPHDHARSRAYRWNEDGLAGICDDHQFLCFAVALWNGKDPILKERLFGLTNKEGNHGEDVKEYYACLDNVPTHSYMEFNYKYPHAAFPYDHLVSENGSRDRTQPEFELLDTGIFEQDRYFDVNVKYAKAGPDDLLIEISALNCGPEPAELHVLPTFWFRNDWSWGNNTPKPLINYVDTQSRGKALHAAHPIIGNYYLLDESPDPPRQAVFTENETNAARLYPPDGQNAGVYVKDAFHRYLIQNDETAVNPAQTGTKAALIYSGSVEPNQTKVVRLRLSSQSDNEGEFDQILKQRKQEADEFYRAIAPDGISEDAQTVQRQALAGLLWNKQFYHYDVRKWLAGDPTMPPPPDPRWQGRNHEWIHLDNRHILSVPDKWEYPWYASWDLAFHCVTLALVDPGFAKDQLVLLLKEWFMRSNGQIPAYEWGFGDVNPPVHAWAAMRVYQIERRLTGVGDTNFLERVFQKLLLNFTWWTNRKDPQNRDVFQGGFLGLDNISVFDRGDIPVVGAELDECDGTSWMAMYCLNMLAIALELAQHDRVYEDLATKFVEHFFYISHALNDRPGEAHDSGVGLWDDEDKFYYDVLHLPDGSYRRLRVQTLVGFSPLFAIQTMEQSALDALPGFGSQLQWFLSNNPVLRQSAASVDKEGAGGRRQFCVVGEDRLRAILARMLNPEEFLSPHGIRSVSLRYKQNPYRLDLNGQTYQIDYEPAESSSGAIGGNSNWRGPVWFPFNYLIIESLQRFDHYYGSDFKVECPTGSGKMLTLYEVATELSHRLTGLFLRDADGHRPAFGLKQKFQSDSRWNGLIPLFEYFNGDTGAGLGASRQTGWTSLVAKLIQQSGSSLPKVPGKKNGG